MSQYASLADFAVYGLPSTATEDIEDATITKFLESASAYVDSQLEARGYATPLTEWAEDLTQVVCRLAAHSVIFHRGVNPADPAHQLIVAERTQTLEMVDKIAKGYARFARTTPERLPQGTARVFSGSGGTRGW